MRTLAKYLQNYKKESVLAPFFKFLEVVFDLLVPVVIAQIIDVGIANNDHGYIVQKFFILILMATAKISAQRTLMVKAITIEPRTINGLRRRRRSPMFTPFCT